jgi:hypothetical protein
MSRNPFRLFELVAEHGRGIDVNPADPKPNTRGPQPIREGQRDRVSVARDHDPVHLGAVYELLENRFSRRRRRQRFVQVGVNVVDGFDAEDGSLAAGVRRLQHRREPDLVSRTAALGQRSDRRKARLGNAGIRELPSHRDLVGHQMSCLDADPG